MKIRNKVFQLSSAVFHIVVFFTLFVFSGISAAFLPTTESITGTESFYDGLSIMNFSDATPFDMDLFGNGFGRSDLDAYNIPLPTLALLFPLALLLWIKRCRGLIKKQQNFFAFPVF